MTEFREKIKAAFDVKLYGKRNYFSHWNIKRTPEALYVTQTMYCNILLSRFGMLFCNLVSTALSSNIDLNPWYPAETPIHPTAHQYHRTAIGGITYLANSTCPDLIYSIASLAGSLHSPSDRYLYFSKRMLRYIKSTIHYLPKFPIKKTIIPTSLRVAVDAKWGGCLTKSRSTIRYILSINGAPIFCKYKLQSVLPLSSGEAEYLALSSCVRDISWLRILTYELVYSQQCESDWLITPTDIEIDSMDESSIAHNKESTKVTKHIELRFHHGCD